jgi:hypothetical protein
LDGREGLGFFLEGFDPVTVNFEGLAIGFELVVPVAAVSADVGDGAEVALVLLGPADEFEVVGGGHGRLVSAPILADVLDQVCPWLWLAALELNAEAQRSRSGRGDFCFLQQEKSREGA